MLYFKHITAYSSAIILLYYRERRTGESPTCVCKLSYDGSIFIRRNFMCDHLLTSAPRGRINQHINNKQITYLEQHIIPQVN